MEKGDMEPSSIGRACNLCRLSHTACESARPCRRCISIGKAHLCANVGLRKRGRPCKANANGAKSTKAKVAPEQNGSERNETRPPSSGELGSSQALVPPAASNWIVAKRLKSGPTREDFRIQMPSLRSHMVPLSSSSLSLNLDNSSSSNGESVPQVSVPSTRQFMTPNYRHQTLPPPSPFAPPQSILSSSSSSPPSPSFSSSSDSPEQLYKAFSASSVPSSRHPHQAGNTDRESILENIVSLVIEELREVKQHNRDLRKKLNKVLKRQAKTEQAVIQIKSSSASLNYSTDSEHQYRNGSAVRRRPLPALTELAVHMPFLSKYPIPPDNFVVNDLRKPLYAIRVAPLTQHDHELHQPPAIVFVNDAYSDLLGYALVELLGRDVHSVSYIDPQTKNEVRHKMFQSTPHSVSRPVSIPVFKQCKNGRLFLCDCRHQAFYNQYGYVRWFIAVIESFRELRRDEVPLEWMLPAVGSANPSNPPGSDLGEHSQPRESYNKYGFGQQQQRHDNQSQQATVKTPIPASPTVDDRIDLQDLIYQFLQPSPPGPHPPTNVAGDTESTQ